ncbi:unnamed protein product [Oncorhynchus mykiss]|uniref:Uncharacterized protein n=1 Tax=Oncorhynchus mykiss TaxID=8022 RepID=A0A060Z0L1_ONCMY|nr:unnamed protein product [Oncorhynchus mykiss]
MGLWPSCKPQQGEAYEGLTEEPLAGSFNTTQESTLIMTEAEERRRAAGHGESNGFHSNHHGSSNHGNLPDLVQQSSSSSPSTLDALKEQFGSKASSPFGDPRSYQTSPTEDEEESSAGLFTSELLHQEQARLAEARKISVVNVNPTNIRPHSDTPEIRKYKKRFNSEILCAALWGKTPQIFSHTCEHTHTCEHIHTGKVSHTCEHIHTGKVSHTHVNTHTGKVSHTHVNTHTGKVSHTHVNTHTQAKSLTHMNTHVFPHAH